MSRPAYHIQVDSVAVQQGRDTFARNMIIGAGMCCVVAFIAQEDLGQDGAAAATTFCPF